MTSHERWPELETMLVIDSHIHCGVQNVSQPLSSIQPLLDRAGIQRAVLFAPVEDIYDRDDPDFADDAGWRRSRERAHAYLLGLAQEHPHLYVYYFVWNDFEVGDLDPAFSGIKWHRHEWEPVYHYDDPRCGEMLDAICARRLPIVLEESLDNTLYFLERVAGRTPVIIPHLGLCSGGFEALLEAGVWESERVYADTALARESEIGTFLERYGPDRLIFGSDWPFGRPGSQLETLRGMGLSNADLERICAGTLLALFDATEREPGRG